MPSQLQIDLLIGSANVGKASEIQSGLNDLPLQVHTLIEFPHLPGPAEVGSTYEENAHLKANYYRAQTGLWTLADDSGLEVEQLEGKPGVLTARYGGPNLTDTERINYLLSKLSDSEPRRARFVCVIALSGRSFSTVVRGECTGRIAFEPKGDQGFGYDPVFIPDGYDLTFAQLSPSVKAHISHRARAVREARRFIESKIYELRRP